MIDSNLQTAYLRLDQVSLSGKRVLFREDFNVPIENGVIQSAARIQAALPGIKQALNAGAQVLLMSHLGRPEAGDYQDKYSLRPIAEYLSKILHLPVKFVADWYKPDFSDIDKIILFENVRFLAGETEDSEDLAKYMASFCDVFVMDAFASAHRAHASTVGVAKFAPVAVAGPLLVQELQAIDKIMHDPAKPLVAIIGGSKISSKIKFIDTLINLSDYLLIGGGMANTFLLAQGCDVGASLCEVDQLELATRLLFRAQQENCEILLPMDVIVKSGQQKSVIMIEPEDCIMDIGRNTIAQYSNIILKAKTILWNGPMGVFEDPKFGHGTQQIAQAIANSCAFSLAGGGDTVSALEQFKLEQGMSYISTGGGAFMEYLEAHSLPAVAVLSPRS